MISKQPMPGPTPPLPRFAACLILLLLFAGGIRNAAAAAPATEGGSLDTAAIRSLYLEGDFDRAIVMLENSLADGAARSHGDSVFAFKHLGVMHAAREETREKGKAYMHLLLEVEPAARILEMYAGDMIFLIFKNIQDDFEAARRRFERAERQLGGGRVEERPETAKPAAQPPAGERPRHLKPAYVWMGAAAIATAGAVAWFYYSDDEPKTRNVVVNHQLD